MADTAAPFASLEEVRQAITAIDAELVALLNRRASMSLAAGELKRVQGQIEIFHPGREADLMKQLEAMSCGPLPKEHLRAVYREILSSSRCLQRPQRLAFPGPEGSFLHIAGLELLGSLVEFQPKHSLADVFAAISDGTCDIGIVSLESLLQGGAGQGFDLFLRHPELHIRAETGCCIRHRLSSIEDSSGSRTRFVLIGRTPADRPRADKSSILFALSDKASRLSAMLRIFASHAISLRNLESRPMPEEPDNFMFFADIECDIYAEKYAAVLDAAREQCLFLRVLGSYPSNTG